MKHDGERLARAIERSRRMAEQDEELRRVAPSAEARTRLMAEESSLRCLELACELYAGRSAFGERVGGGGGFRTITFAELWGRVRAVASGLRRLGLVEEGERVGVCGVAGVDWVVVDLACLYLGAVSVPLPTAAPPAEMGAVVAEAGLACVVSSAAQIDRVAATLGMTPSTRSLVVMDAREEDAEGEQAIASTRQWIARVHGEAVAVRTLAEVERLGREQGPVPPAEVAPDALRTIVYTSGSTGVPKGAMFPERLWASYLRAPWPWEIPDVPHVGFDYMPLNHLAGRGSILRSLVNGGVTHFARAADMSTLFDDIQAARPTSLFLVPRAASMIHQAFQTEVARRRGSEDEVMEEMRRSFLGDRLVYLTTGTAPTAPEVAAFLERGFDVPVLDGYGSTEAGAITIDGRVDAGNVIAYGLVDVPELGYRTSDRPYPRGELRVRTLLMIPGYYRNPAATEELFDDEGYLRTGDVVEERGPGELAWIDRKKNVLKLAQGEFVALSRLEALYTAGSPHVRQLYLHGSSVWPYLLAVVVPVGDADKAVLATEIGRVAARAGLRPYEIPRDFLVETEPFTREGGLLTESNKPSRPRLRARYEGRLAALHDAIERSQLEDLHALTSLEGEESGVRTAADKVGRAISVALGIPGGEALSADRSFVDLGGDSLAAARLSTLVEDVAGVAIPVGTILDRTRSVRTLVRAVEDELSGRRSGRATFAAVHGAGATTVRVEDLHADRFLDPGELVRRGEPAQGEPAPYVLLTGANGFLGRFLLLELLERARTTGGRVVALVRAPDDAAAEERLAASYAGVDPTLPARFAALAQGRLEVVAADLIAPHLGLSEERWDRLGGELTTIVHAGALVNHTLSYAQLFEPNVLGTMEVARLALRGRARVAFVSTVGVAAGLPRADPVREDEDAASLWKSLPVDGGYAVGYSTSKWAGEVLLGDLAARTGVPVTVFRCSMILPPEGPVGQVNAGDLLTRLLHGIVVTGIAPRSFYAADARAPAFDGLPVDFGARAIAGVALSPRAGFAVRHVVEGRREGGVSLDRMVDWVEEAGYPVQRIDDHAAWVRAFRERLAALPPAEQHRSPLPILQRWERPLGREVSFDNRALRADLAALAGGVAPAIPAIDALSVRQYLKNMVYQGIIGHPGFSTAA